MWIPTEHEKYGVGKFAVYFLTRLLLNQRCNVNVATQRYRSHTVCLLVFVFIARPAWFVYICLEKKQVFHDFV